MKADLARISGPWPSSVFTETWYDSERPASWYGSLMVARSTSHTRSGQNWLLLIELGLCLHHQH